MKNVFYVHPKTKRFYQQKNYLSNLEWIQTYLSEIEFLINDGKHQEIIIKQMKPALEKRIDKLISKGKI